MDTERSSYEPQNNSGCSKSVIRCKTKDGMYDGQHSYIWGILKQSRGAYY